jgi:hypothetical protein
VGGRSRIVRKVRLSPPRRSAQGIPQAAMNPAVSGGRTVEPVTKGDF